MADVIDGLMPAGGQIPPFSLPRLGGGEQRLPDSAAKGLTLAIFYKNTCPTCRLGLPFAQRLHEQVAPVGGRVVAIAQDPVEATAEFARELGLTMPILIDGTDYPVSRLYELVSVPTLYLIDQAGTIKSSGVGFNKTLLAAMASDLAASIGAPAPILYRDGETIPDFKPG